MIIAVANQKGGVGKTTLAVHVAAWLARLSKRVVLVDGDPQGNATSWVMGESPQNNGFWQLLVDGRSVKSVARPANGWGFYMIPGDQRTGQALTTAILVLRKPRTLVADALRPLENVADYVLVDMPPSKATGFAEVLLAADYALVPTQMERHSLDGVRLMAKTCREIVEEHGRGPRLLGVVPNMVRKHTREHRHHLQRLASAFKGAVWPPVPQSVHVASACSFGTTLFDYAPDLAVTEAMIRVCRRVLENTGGATK